MKTQVKQTLQVLAVPTIIVCMTVVLCFIYFKTAVSRAETRAYEVASDSAAEQIATLQVAMNGRFTVLEYIAASFACMEPLDFDGQNALTLMGVIQDRTYFRNMYIADTEGNA